MNNYLVIIPTFNESKTIQIILNKIFELNLELDVLVVDDNSPDNTYKIIENHKLYNIQLYLMKRENKRGLGSAYIDAFKWAIDRNYQNVIQIDADMSHNPDDIYNLLIESKTYDVVIGSRYVDGVNVVNWPLRRLILSYAANLYSQIITGLPIKDSTGGFKCFRSSVLESINLSKITSEGYSFQIEINFLSWIKGFTIKEIPIIFSDRTVGESKMSKGIILEAIYMVPLLKLRKLFGCL